METILFILIGILIGGIVAFSLISHYSIIRTVKYFILIIMFLYSIALLVVSILFTSLSSGDPTVLASSIAIWAIIAGFWLKTPLQILKD